MKINRSGIIFLVILLVVEAIIIMTQWTGPLSWGTVPITGMRAATTYILLWLVWPIVGGLILVLVMPRILGPLFLKIKGAIWIDYKNAYVDLPHPQLTQKRILQRSIYLSLLTMGITSMLIYVIPPELLVPAGAITELSVFHLASVSSIAGIVVPISIAMWATSWSFREASLVHYKIPDEGSDELYEIEPIHLRYDSLLKGYAGFSSILFLINLMLNYITTQEVMALMVLYVFMHMSLLTLPALYVHSRMNHMWLRKNLPKARRFTKADVRILEDEL